MASACRSTALVVTFKPAKSSSCWRPCSKLVSLPTTAIMRRTAGEYSVLDVPFGIARALSPMTMRAYVIRPLEGDRPESGEEMFGTHLVKAGLLAARTRHGARQLYRGCQQLFQQPGCQLVRGGSGGHFHGFQIECAALAGACEEDF
jgi:hypothetical protein